MKTARVLTGLAPALLSAPGAGAQSYPSKPVRLISPYPPGGGTDATARIISQALSDQLGQQVIVDNRAGASGRIGTEIASKSPADGYTLLLGNVAPLAILPAAVAKLPYDSIHDFNPVSLIATSDYVLTMHLSLPARSLKELLALAKAKPGELTYASSGTLGAPHLAGELINLTAGVKILHVPYKGNGPAAIAVMSGESTMMFGSGPSVVPHVKAGRMRALATTGKKTLYTGAARGGGIASRLRGDPMVRHPRSGGCAERHHRTPEQGDRARDRQPQGRAALREPRYPARFKLARRVRRLHQGRDGQVAQGDPGREHQG